MNVCIFEDIECLSSLVVLKFCLKKAFLRSLLASLFIKLFSTTLLLTFMRCSGNAALSVALIG